MKRRLFILLVVFFAYGCDGSNGLRIKIKEHLPKNASGKLDSACKKMMDDCVKTYALMYKHKDDTIGFTATTAYDLLKANYPDSYMVLTSAEVFDKIKMSDTLERKEFEVFQRKMMGEYFLQLRKKMQR